MVLIPMSNHSSTHVFVGTNLCLNLCTDFETKRLCDASHKAFCQFLATLLHIPTDEDYAVLPWITLRPLLVEGLISQHVYALHDKHSIAFFNVEDALHTKEVFCRLFLAEVL